MDKISIIIPVKNLEKHIDRCLESILRQTYKDYEVIMVFDNCTDRSKAISKKLLKNAPHTFIDENFNRAGLSRNAGLEKATGEYVWFIDGDDYLINDNAFQIVIDAFNETGVTVAHLTNIENSLHGTKPVVWRSIYSRELIGDTRFPSIRIGESYPFHSEIKAKPDYKECSVADVLYHYSDRPDSTSNVALLIQTTLRKVSRKKSECVGK